MRLIAVQSIRTLASRLRANKRFPPDGRVVEAVLTLLRDAEPDVRRMAIDTLATLKDARAVDPLLAMLQDDDASVRREAIDALGRLGDPRALPTLEEIARQSQGSEEYYPRRSAQDAARQAIRHIRRERGLDV